MIWNLKKQTMQKKIEDDLITLANSVLQMKNRENVFLLKEKSKEIYEKLSVLAFVEEYVNSTLNLKETKLELLEKVEKGYLQKEDSFTEKEVFKTEITTQEEIEASLIKEITKPTVEELLEQPFAELEEIMFSEIETSKEDIIEVNLAKGKDVAEVKERKIISLEEELQDTFSVDLMADLFENAQPKSLNDRLGGTILIGLNDRIVFVKNLFGGSQEDFNRVVSQLSTFKSDKEAKNFISNMVKPDYNWTNHEELEKRFMAIIERKFA